MPATRPHRTGHVTLQPPSVPLTLRGMRRPRHRPRRSGRLTISLLSVLALVALGCLPALAQAEECTDASCKQYEPEIPTAGNDRGPKPHKAASDDEAGASEAPAGAGQQRSSAGESEEGDEKKGAAAAGKGGNGGSGPAGKGGTPAGGGTGEGSTKLGDEQALGATAQGENASHSDGGSSPLVPILIAIAVLAAISIGAVVYRQRRQGGAGSAVSPNA